MATNKWHRRQTERRLDVVKVTIEDVNLTATPFPVAQGRDRRESWGLFDIDLSHGVGGSFPTPTVGEVWWIKRSVGSRWVLDHKVDVDREASEGGGGGGGSGDRSDVPGNVELGFNIREKKKEIEYEAFVTFDAVTVDDDGDAVTVDHYVIDWVPCTKAGNIIPDEKVRQHLWSPNDAAIDEVDDPANDYYALLPGNVPRPKVWYWKARVRAVSEGGGKGEWSAWTDPSLPIRDSLPEPPAPSDIDLSFRWKDTSHQPVFSAVVKFDDVNYWDIPGFDYEDDVTEYEIQLMPLERGSGGAFTIDGGDGNTYKRADPNNDGEPWEVRRKKVKDKDEDDTFVTLGTMGEDITAVDTVFDVDETGVVGTPVVPFIVETDTGERWLVTDRDNVAGSVYTYEVYRQFNNTADQAHLTSETLRWLKDPFRYKVDFSRIERPRTVYWWARVRSKDRFNRIGPWSGWTLPALPWRSIDFEVPVPLQLRADIHLREHKTHPEYKLVATFKDPAPNGFNIPGGDLQDDLHHYGLVAEALVPDADGYIDGGGGVMYRIPDQEVGTVASDIAQLASTATINLKSDLSHSFKQIIDTGERFFLRIETPNPADDTQIGNEVVAVDGVDEPVNSADLSRVLTIERAQKGSGDHGHNTGNKVYLLMEHVRRETVHDKDEDEPGHRNAHYSVDFGHIPHGSRFYWRVRARSVDGFGHKSAWTNWTSPISPETDPDLVIDAPGYVRLGFDRVHRDRWTRHRAIVEWEEVDYLAPDGDRESDVTRYGVQLANSDGDEVDLEMDASTTSLSVLEARQDPGPTPFFILVDDESIKVTLRTQMNDTQYAYTIERGQKGTTAAPHPQGSRIYQYPFAHQTVSAKQDTDPNNYNRVPFPKAQKFRYYKARVRAFDRYNRTSAWSAWTAEGTPADQTPPPRPQNVQLDIDNHKIIINWDFKTNVQDPDSDLAALSDEAAYFQVQVSTVSNFNSILKFDRYVASTHKTFRMKKPRGSTFYVRVRAVDGSDNKSAWVTTSGAQNGVPTPSAPAITYDVNEETKRVRAQVLLATGVTHLDDDINGYEFELQPAEFKRAAETLGSLEGTLTVNNSSNIPATSFTAYIQDEQVTVTNVAGLDWSISRGVNGSTAVIHRNRVKVQYFRTPQRASGGAKTRRMRTGEEEEADNEILCIFPNCERGLWYRARVRAKNSKGLWGNWSAWS